MNSADDSFSDLVSVKPLTWNFEGIQQVLHSDFSKIRILEILNFNACFKCWLTLSD